MSVRPLNPKMQKRLQAVKRAMDAGLPNPSEARELADWLESGLLLAEAADGDEIAAALDAFRQAHDRAHAFDPYQFKGGYAAAIDVLELMVDYLRSAQTVMELRAAGRLRLAPPDTLATWLNVAGELEP